MAKFQLISIILICVFYTSACSIVPWVKPYDRELLADPIMSFSRDAISDKYRQHVYDVREGARGAGLSQGGGCGCN